MPIHAQDHGRVRVLQFDRPDSLNAFDAHHYGLLADALDTADADDGIGAIVITGAGRAFSAGADLKALHTGQQEIGAQFARMLNAFVTDTPVLAAVNGLAIGIGTTMLLHCDVVLADPSARFRTPFAALGTTPEAGSSYLLAERTNNQFANLMLIAGEWVDADAALRNGLVARVTAPGQVLDETVAMAAQISQWSPAALAAAKRLTSHGRLEASRLARDRETQEARSVGTGGLSTFFSS
jgi:enoyl-CoA hydratase/carnithine racemase